jgi:recombination protein RecT
LVNRSGNATVFTGVVFSDQKYTYHDGSTRELIVHNETELVDPADITHAYAVGWVRGSAMPVIELWRTGKIAKHRDRYNKVGDKHYSFENWEMYARKVPLLQVLKYMPMSPELVTAITLNDAAERGHQGLTIDQASAGDYVAPEGDNDRDDEQKPPGEKKTALLACTSEQFAENLTSWKNIIASGKRTADQIIQTAETKYTLSDDQKKQIRGLPAPEQAK